MQTLSLILFSFSFFLCAHKTQASPAPHIDFPHFLKSYQKLNFKALQAEQSLSIAQKTLDSSTDDWKSRIEAQPQIGFLDRNFESGLEPDVSNRTQNLVGSFTQSMPTGTSLILSGQKYIEIQNPLFQSIDRSYSAKISQDLFRNSFGKTQRASAQKAINDFEIAQIEYREQTTNSCGEAFTLYSNAYIQQQVASLLEDQLKDAKKALTVSRQNYKDRLINKIDKLSSESDYIRAKLETDRANQKLINLKRQMLAYMKNTTSMGFQLSDPNKYIDTPLTQRGKKTLREILASKRLESQKHDVQRSRSDRWTDVQLGLEIGENVGRRAAGSGTFNNFTEDYLKATLTVGMDIINKTEDSDLRNAIQLKNSLAIQNISAQKTQKSQIDNLFANNTLLKDQVESSAKQVQLLEEKVEIAFNQMQRAKLDFETYLLHRNTFIQQKINYLNLQKELLLNIFDIKKQFSHTNLSFCEAQA